MVSKILIISLIVCTANAAVWMSYLPEKPKEFGKFDSFIFDNLIKAAFLFMWCLLIRKIIY